MILHINLLVLFVLNPFFVTCVAPGPKYPPTKGEVWPKPQHQVKHNTHYVMDRSLNITKPYYTCDILEEAIKRHRQNFARRQSFINFNKKHNKNKLQHRDKPSKVKITANKIEFSIELTKRCENYPHLEMDEKYQLTVGENVVLSSASIWGILRGLETFNQLIYYSDDRTEMRINATKIKDYPAYKHRGLLIDTGRHYLKPETINLLIDAMEMNKMNVLHWHIVDDESFPYQSTTYPTLSKRGAFHSSMVYTRNDIKKIIERGRLAGIRVVPEFDVPGHVRSWGNAFPHILTKCYIGKNVVSLGPLNPIKYTTYMFLKQLYNEVRKLFPDEYLHLGGDEVDTGCWKTNLKIRQYVKKHHLDINKLNVYFMNKVKTLLPPKAKYIVWQEVFDSGVPLPSKTILQVWKYGWVQEMVEILEANHRVVFSSSWYLDELSYDWEAYYRVDPRKMVYNETLNATGLQDIVGGEACMWGETVDDTNIIARIWPRTSAVAERLWTGIDYSKAIDPVIDYVRRRIEEHVCRMRYNGISAEPPNGPSFCLGTR